MVFFVDLVLFCGNELPDLGSMLFIEFAA